MKKYDEMVANPPKATPEPTKQFTKQPVKKQKEIWYAKSLPKDKAEGTLAPYRFDVLAQLANIPARITLYELPRLSKSTREALREALAMLRSSWLRFWLNHGKKIKKTASTPLNIPPALPSRQMTYRLRGNMIGPCTSQV